MDRLHELFQEYRADHSIEDARKMSQKQALGEMIDDLCECEMTTEEKLDKIIAVLELMSYMKD